MRRSDVTAKTFRTWGGDVCGRPCPGPVRAASAATAEAEKQIVAAIDVAAEVLGNTRTVCRNCYVHPAVLSAYREGELVDRWKAARATSRLDRGERMVLSLLEDRAA